MENLNMFQRVAVTFGLVMVFCIAAQVAFSGSYDNPYARQPVGSSTNHNPFVPHPDCPYKHVSQDCDGERDKNKEPTPEVVCRNNKDC